MEYKYNLRLARDHMDMTNLACLFENLGAELQDLEDEFYALDDTDPANNEMRYHILDRLEEVMDKCYYVQFVYQLSVASKSRFADKTEA